MGGDQLDGQEQPREGERAREPQCWGHWPLLISIIPERQMCPELPKAWQLLFTVLTWCWGSGDGMGGAMPFHSSCVDLFEMRRDGVAEQGGKWE